MFLGWALVLTFPLIRNFNSAIPLGSEHSGTVPFFNLWTLQWNIEQALRGFPNYWNPPFFAPSVGVFAYSELEPVTAFLALPLWKAVSPAAGYNSVVILFLTLNGWFAFCLLKLWRIPSLAAGGAALLMQSLPFVAQEMGVLQLTAIFGFLWLLVFLQRFLKQPTPVNGIGLALGVPLIFFTCSYYGLFSVVFLPLAFLGMRSPAQKSKALLIRLGLALLMGTLLTLPPLLVQRKILAEHNFTRSEKTIRENSAHPEDYLKTLDYNIVTKKINPRPSPRGQRLFPGWGLLALAALGFAVPSKHVRWRLKLFLLAAILLSYILSLGLNLTVGDWQPYQSFRQIVPGFKTLRSPFRFAVMGQIHLALLSGLGLAAIMRLPRKSTAIAGIITVLAVFEALALPLPLHPVPPFEGTQPWQQWIQQHTENPRIVLLPFAANGKTAAFEQTTIWMLENSSLPATMLNGYSGFFPRAQSFLRTELTTFPSAESIFLLGKYQTDYVIVFHALKNAPTRDTITTYLSPVYFDAENQVSIFALN